MPITNYNLITPSSMPRPPYGVPVIEPGFGTKLTRIVGDVGTAIPVIGSTWHCDARHGYSRRNPWNCDGTLAYIEQRGGIPSKLVLDAVAWKPLLGNVGNFRACTEVRWHPTQRTWMVGWNRTTLEIVVFDALSDQTIKRVGVGGPNTLGLMGEGSLSNDASMVALGDTLNNVVLVDIVNSHVSPVQKAGFVRAPSHLLGNCTVSPLSTPAGGRFVAKASDTPELVHVYDFGADLILKHRFESDLTLSHGDVGLTPSGREVFCGGMREWFGAPGFTKDDGRICAIDLESGQITHISAGRNQLGAAECADQHCSLRGPKGWVLTTYAGAQEASGRFLMELVAWKLDGSRDCVRFGVTRTNESKTIGAADPYRNEAHGVMRPDGKAVMFASNWQHATSAAGSVDNVKSFVYELDSAGPIEPPPPLDRFYIKQGRRCYPNECLWDRESDSPVLLEVAVRIMNEPPPPTLDRYYIKQGRRCYPNECLWDRTTDSPVMLEAAVRIMNGGAQ